MKKFLLFLTLTAVLLAVSLPVGASEDIQKVESLPEVYADVLKNSPYCHYALYDIDKDGASELILAEDPDAKFSQCQIYTRSDNKVINLGTYSVIYGIYTYDGNGILFADGGTGLLCHNRFYLENDEIKTDSTPYISYCIAPDIEEYTHNGKQITKSRYDELSAELAPVKFRLTDAAVTVLLDGKEMEFDQPPVIITGRVMVPLRAIFESLGYTIEWLPTSHTAIARKENYTVTVQIDNPCVIYGSNTYQCDVPPLIMSDRTLVPLRAVSECSGCTVIWNNATRTVTITK